jgi:hypothetical protein
LERRTAFERGYGAVLAATEPKVELMWHTA